MADKQHTITMAAATLLSASTIGYSQARIDECTIAALRTYNSVERRLGLEEEIARRSSPVLKP